jgi:hypothetical protein
MDINNEKLQEIFDNAPEDKKEARKYFREHNRFLHTNPKNH